ncbi:hypothetical protein ACM66B_005561 [Microbotryomycetes sp. NB124-2]
MPRVIGLGQGLPQLPSRQGPTLTATASPHAIQQSLSIDPTLQPQGSTIESQLKLKKPRRQKPSGRFSQSANDNARTLRLLTEAHDEIRRLTKLYELLQVRLIAKGLDPVQEITRFHLQLDQAAQQQGLGGSFHVVGMPPTLFQGQHQQQMTGGASGGGGASSFVPTAGYQHQSPFLPQLRHPTVARLSTEGLPPLPPIPGKSLGRDGKAGDIAVSPTFGLSLSPLASVPSKSSPPSLPMSVTPIVTSVQQGLPLNQYTYIAPRKTRAFDRKAFKAKSNNSALASSSSFTARKVNGPLPSATTIANRDPSSAWMSLPPLRESPDMRSASASPRPMLPPLRISSEATSAKDSQQQHQQVEGINEAGEAAMESAQTLLQLSSASSSGASGNDLRTASDGLDHGGSRAAAKTFELPPITNTSSTRQQRSISFKLPRLEIPSSPAGGVTRNSDSPSRSSSSLEQRSAGLNTATTSAVPLSAWIRGSAVETGSLNASLPFATRSHEMNDDMDLDSDPVVTIQKDASSKSNLNPNSSTSLSRFSKPLDSLQSRPSSPSAAAAGTISPRFNSASANFHRTNLPMFALGSPQLAPLSTVHRPSLLSPLASTTTTVPAVGSPLKPNSITSSCSSETKDKEGEDQSALHQQRFDEAIKLVRQQKAQAAAAAVETQQQRH